VYLLEVENLNYCTRNTSTTGSTNGMNKDMPLILSNNHATGVTDEVREVTWFYKHSVYGALFGIRFQTMHNNHNDKDRITYAATVPNYPHQCILIGYFNNCNFSKIE
jgi:hypothetical protein